MHPQFLSNTYLVGEPGGAGFFVDAGGPGEPAGRRGRAPRHDADARAAHPPPPRPRRASCAQAHRALARPRRCSSHPDERVDGVTGDDGARRDRRASATCEVAHAAHARPHRRACSRCSSRATSSPATRCSRTRSAACARPGTPPTPTSSTRSWTCCWRSRPRPSSAPATPSPPRSADEWEHNAFVRVWRGLDPEGDEPCTAHGRAGDARAARRRLRRRPQGLGALARRRATTSSPARRSSA